MCVRASYTHTSLKKDDILIKVGSRYGIMQMALLHCKKCFSYFDFFVLFPNKISKNFLNQEGFSRQVKIIVLFSEKTSQN